MKISKSYGYKKYDGTERLSCELSASSAYVNWQDERSFIAAEPKNAVKVNWSCCGAVEIDQAKEFADVLMAAVRRAKAIMRRLEAQSEIRRGR